MASIRIGGVVIRIKYPRKTIPFIWTKLHVGTCLICLLFAAFLVYFVSNSFNSEKVVSRHGRDLQQVFKSGNIEIKTEKENLIFKSVQAFLGNQRIYNDVVAKHIKSATTSAFKKETLRKKYLRQKGNQNSKLLNDATANYTKSTPGKVLKNVNITKGIPEPTLDTMKGEQKPNNGVEGQKEEHLSLDKKQKLKVESYRIIHQIARPPDSAYNINITASDIISLDRTVTDFRTPFCLDKKYDLSNNSTASVIIPFYNEALSVILRNIHSILNKTPPKLLKEIIIVDDCSTHENLKEPLENYVKLLPKVSIIRNRKREGLIRTRMVGARSASGRYLVFLDAHVEVNVMWLEPLIDYLERHPNQAIQPLVDVINENTFEYNNGNSDIHKGSLNWNLKYVWTKISNEEYHDVATRGRPFSSSTMVGCAIGVDRHHFFRLGGFDEGLEVWGGENIELAFRYWMCGGEVKTVPCSRVGHIFKKFPYGFKDGKWVTMFKNSGRVAKLWMGDYQKYFFAFNKVYGMKQSSYTLEENNSISQRKRFIDSLQCKSFKWYLENVATELQEPPKNSIYYGEIVNKFVTLCFKVEADNVTIGLTQECYPSKIIPMNFFSVGTDGVFRYHDKCVHTNFNRLEIGICPQKKSDGQVTWTCEGSVFGMHIVQRETMKDGSVRKRCVMQVTSYGKYEGQQMPEMAKCQEDQIFQKWMMTHKFDFT